MRAARAFALLNMALHDAAVGCWDAKYTYFNPRPSQLDPDDQDGDRPAELPVVHLGALDVLGRGRRRAVLPLPERAGHFETKRDEAAISRLYGGIHYRTDIEVGKDHGKRIGDYTVRFAMHDGADH